MSRHEQVYRRLLRLYPERFRSRYADEMTRLFADQLLDAKASPKPFAVAALWIRSMVDLVATVPGHHIRREQPVPQTVDSAPVVIPANEQPARNRTLRVVIGLLPLWVLLFLLVAAPSYMAPIFASPPEMFGLPAGIVFLGLGLSVTAIGVAIIGLTSSTKAAIVALVGFTAPSLVLILMGPAMIVAIIDLSPQTGG